MSDCCPCACTGVVSCLQDHPQQAPSLPRPSSGSAGPSIIMTTSSIQALIPARPTAKSLLLISPACRLAHVGAGSDGAVSRRAVPLLRDALPSPAHALLPHLHQVPHPGRLGPPLLYIQNSPAGILVCSPSPPLSCHGGAWQDKIFRIYIGESPPLPPPPSAPTTTAAEPSDTKPPEPERSTAAVVTEDNGAVGGAR